MSKGHVGLLCAAAASLSASTHSLRIKNADSYVKGTHAPAPLTIALRNSSNGAEGTQFFNFVYESLKLHPNVERVVLADHLP